MPGLFSALPFSVYSLQQQFVLFQGSFSYRWRMSFTGVEKP